MNIAEYIIYIGMFISIATAIYSLYSSYRHTKYKLSKRERHNREKYHNDNEDMIMVSSDTCEVERTRALTNQLNIWKKYVSKKYKLADYSNSKSGLTDNKNHVFNTRQKKFILLFKLRMVD